MKPQMSSDKQDVSRLLVCRFGMVFVALAVLAAGCSQSENGASEGSEPAASSSQAGLSSAAPSSPAAESTTTTQASVEEELQGSSSGIATATTLLSSADGGNALSGRVVELIEAGMDACADLYEMRCARALWDACMQVRIELGSILESRIDVSTSETIEIDDLRDNVCSLFEMAQYWELHSILLARYGDNFYRSDTGFYSFRAQLTGRAFSLFPKSCDFECSEYPATSEDLFARYLSDDLRMRFHRFASSLRRIFLSLHPSVVSMSEDVANRILGAYEDLEIDDQCYDPLLTDIFSNYKNGIFKSNYSLVQQALSSCIRDLCIDGNERFFLGCYWCSEEYEEFFSDCSSGHKPSDLWYLQSIAIPIHGGILRYVGSSIYSERLLFWEVLKYSCATGEIHFDAYADDTCRTVAYNICLITRGAFSFLRDRSFSLIESSICDLGRELDRLLFEDEKDECLRGLKIFLANENLFTVSDGRCLNATQRCIESQGPGQSREFAYRKCSGFEKYFHFETYWKNIPLLCSQGNPQAEAFGASECYDSISLFCGSELNANLKYNTYNNYHRIIDEFESEDMPFREREKISMALCEALLQYYNNTNDSKSEKLNLLPNESQTTLMLIDDYEILDPETIDSEQTSTELTSDNLDLIRAATTVCTSSFSVSGNSECAIALWKSCFNLFYSRAKNESSKSEVYRSSEYVCTAAWIAELARMASVLLSSFPEDYQEGNFNQFLQYIADEAVDNGEGILAIDEDGTARPNLNREGLSPEVAESLPALGNSIAQLIQPYLNLPTANSQINILLKPKTLLGNQRYEAANVINQVSRQ